MNFAIVIDQNIGVAHFYKLIIKLVIHMQLLVFLLILLIIFSYEAIKIHI